MRLIDADAFIERLREGCEDKATIEYINEIHDLLEIEVEFHPIDAEPIRHGHYIGESDGYADGYPVYDIWSCSECGCYFEDWDDKPTYKYCPNCGARMENDDNM